MDEFQASKRQQWHPEGIQQERKNLKKLNRSKSNLCLYVPPCEVRHKMTGDIKTLSYVQLICSWFEFKYYAHADSCAA